MNAFKCQMENKDIIRESRLQLVPLPLLTRLNITISRCLDPRPKRFIKQCLKWFTTRQADRNNVASALPEMDSKLAVLSLRTGDMVRIRSLNEIQASLDSHGRIKGCRFMPEMEPYCGTIQRVFKPVERFINESDYTIRKARGLVLLENVYCQGVAEAGRCDRSCFYFWRTEWLEYIDTGE